MLFDLITRKIQFRLVVLCSFDHRIDKVSLTALCNLFPHKIPYVGGAILGGAAGNDGRASRRHLVDDANVQVSVQGQCQSPRDGRCGHGEDVGVGDLAIRAGLAHQLEALLHTEAMLLVDDDQAEIGEVGLILLQCVGADDELCIAAHDAALRLALGRGVERAGKKHDLVRSPGARRDGVCEQLARGEVVLRGEDLGGRHQRDLGAVLDGNQRGLHGDDRLSRSDIALQQTAHGLRFAHVGDDLAEDTFLRRRGMEGKHLLDRLAHCRAGSEGGSDALAHTAALQFEAKFEVEEFFEDEALVRGRSGAHQLDHWRAGFGEVDGLQRFHPRRQAKPLEHRGRKRLDR